MPIKPLAIHYPDGSTVELLPVARDRLLALRQKFVELHALWLGYACGVGDTVADPIGWRLLGEIAAMLPRRDNPAVCGFDLELISNDYALIELLFFAGASDVSADDLHGYSIVNFDMNKFRACKILDLHRLNPKAILNDANEFRLQESKPRPVEPIAA